MSELNRPSLLPSVTVDQFFEAVQAEFDAGRDPLDQADLIAWLEQHPEALSDFADLIAAHASLQELAAATPSVGDDPAEKSGRVVQLRPWLGLAAAAALLLLVFFHDGSEPKPDQVEAKVPEIHTPTEPEPPAEPSNAQVLSVRHASSEVHSSFQPSQQVAVEGAVILSLKTTTKRVVNNSRHQS